MEEFLSKLWKDAVAGRGPLAPADHPALEESDDYPGVVTAPAGRVKKYLPNRPESCEGRFIWDARMHSEGGCKHNHPPALTPRHRELARTIKWWKVRFPLVRVFLSKRDVAAAFKLIYVNVDDLGGMATEVDGRALRRAYNGARKTLVCEGPRSST